MWSHLTCWITLYTTEEKYVNVLTGIVSKEMEDISTLW